MSINSAFLNMSPRTSAVCLQALEASSSKTMLLLRNEMLKWYQQIMDVSNIINMNSVNGNRGVDAVYSLCVYVAFFLNTCKHSEIQNTLLKKQKWKGKHIVKKHYLFIK